MDCCDGAAKVFAMAANARTTAIVLVMAGSADEAAQIARTLVTERLAACANIIGPVRSIYRWRGAVEEAREHWLVIKTRKELYSMVERKVRELHSYEVPEILALAPSAGSAAYLEWIFASTRGAAAPRRRAARQS